MVGIKKSKLILGIFIPILVFFLMSHNTFAATTHYSSATVNFYAAQQVNATVNLPWSVNPGSNRFFLNDVWFNDNDYDDLKLAYISGRVVLEVNPKTTTNFYVCGRDASVSWGTGATSYCLGSISVKYTDNSSSIQNNIPVYFNEVSSPYTYNIYYDFNLQLDANKIVDFIQFHFFSSTGYDVISRNTNWNNTTLMVMVEGRASISAFETPPSGTDIANDLLQTQVGQNETIINQNQEVIDQNNEAYDNISNQSSEDIEGSTNNQTTSLINVINGFIGAFSGINATNCNLNLEFPNYAGGTRIVNICSGKEKAPRIVEIGSSLILIAVFVPLAYLLIRMIYNEIRSWTNG